jgi:bacterioferritin
VKAKEGVVEQLNNLLTIELTAVNQYFLQAEMCKNWGFDGLYDKLRESSMDEMKDAQELIRHILYLEGVPNLQMMGRVLVGETVPENLRLDLELENNAVTTLRTAIEHCASVGDFTTRNMLEEGIRSEEGQIDWLETQLGTIDLIGLQNYLAQQIK